jgi:hypothetical protein
VKDWEGIPAKPVLIINGVISDPDKEKAGVDLFTML